MEERNRATWTPLELHQQAGTDRQVTLFLSQKRRRHTVQPG